MKNDFPPELVGPRLENGGFYSELQYEVETPPSRSGLTKRIKRLSANQKTKGILTERLSPMAGQVYTAEGFVLNLIKHISEPAHDDDWAPPAVGYRNMPSLINLLPNRSGNNEIRDMVGLWMHLGKLSNDDTFRPAKKPIRPPKTPEEKKKAKEAWKAKEKEKKRVKSVLGGSFKASANAHKIERKEYS
jgi:hypothetical protein